MTPVVKSFAENPVEDEVDTKGDWFRDRDDDNVGAAADDGGGDILLAAAVALGKRRAFVVCG